MYWFEFWIVFICGWSFGIVIMATLSIWWMNKHLKPKRVEALEWDEESAPGVEITDITIEHVALMPNGSIESGIRVNEVREPTEEEAAAGLGALFGGEDTFIEQMKQVEGLSEADKGLLHERITFLEEHYGMPAGHIGNQMFVLALEEKSAKEIHQELNAVVDRIVQEESDDEEESEPGNLCKHWDGWYCTASEIDKETINGCEGLFVNCNNPKREYGKVK